MEVPTQPADKREERRAYMREYMRNRYNADITNSRKYKNALKYKSKFELPDEDFKTFGVHLADVVKLRRILNALPQELVAIVLEAETATA